MDRLSELKRAGIRARVTGSVHADRVMAGIDGAALESQLVLERLRTDFPRILGQAGGRRATDRHAADGLQVTELSGFRGLQSGNADIASTERGIPSPDLVANTLPIYPKPADLPEGGAV